MSTRNVKTTLNEQNDINSRRATKEKMKTDSRENSMNRKRPKPNNANESDKKTSKSEKKAPQFEMDPETLQRRQKQIDYGKNTVGYHNYIQQVPFDQRTKEHPRTPEKYKQYSRRSWDTLIKIWRKKLHEFDSDGDSPNDS